MEGGWGWNTEPVKSFCVRVILNKVEKTSLQTACPTRIHGLICNLNLKNHHHHHQRMAVVISQ